MDPTKDKGKGDPVTDNYRIAIEALHKAADMTSCGYCKQISLDTADKVLANYLAIQDTLSTIDQLSSTNEMVLRSAKEKAMNMLREQVPGGDATLTLRDIFPMGIIPDAVAKRPMLSRVSRILDRKLY